MTTYENDLVLQYQTAKENYAFNMITFDEFNKTSCDCKYRWIQLGNNLADLDTLVPTKPVKTKPIVIPFNRAEVGMMAYVEPRFSGPFSGEGWERVTIVENGKFKAGNQWFSTEDGSPVTTPWGYHVSKIK